ncbi:hypothetical protein [Phenylobacterium sp.]|uniref:hypothetical protein n=1 Tax=Phenylobacterium sp. TaxID=1871053 RepID=UPI00286C1DCF|nr:hypothetical protein [Phenylobacterium sp.]
MRCVIVATSLAALIGLAACDSKPETVAAPAAPKYLARSQQMYAGQEMIDKVDAGTIAAGPAGSLTMAVSGSVGGAGYTNQAFLKRINAGPPKDGVYEVDVVADKPAAASAAGVTPIEVKGAWQPYPADHLKGVRFISKTNSVVAMLPAG